MATGTGGIATRGDCNTIAAGSFSSDLTKCPTKAEILATGKLAVSGSYADNQCVQYANITASYSLTISPTSYTAVAGGATFYLTITSNTSWTVTYPSWCSGATSGSGNASIAVTVAANTSFGSRSGTIAVRTTAGTTITRNCGISQGGRQIETVEVSFYFAMGGHTISGVNVYTSDGTFLSYAELGDTQAIPKTGPLIMMLAGDQPSNIQAYGPSEGVSVSKGSGSQWLVSGYSFGSGGVNYFSMQLFW